MAIFSIVASCSHQSSMAELEKGFIHPPDSAKAYVWWHWLNGNVSREGISRDLEAMAEQGIGGASIFNLREQADPGPVIYGSEAWQRLVDHVFADAKRLGLQLSFQNCGGWATSGGPWVSPDQAMKKLIYGKVRVKGPQKFSGSLPRPVGFDGYYRDVVILAYPQHDQGPSRMRTALAEISCDNEILNKELIADENIITEAEITVRTDPVSLTFEFQSPFMDAVSSGHLYDKAMISAESFTSPAGDWRETPAGLKAYGDKAFCWGINGLKFRSYMHQADETYPGWQMNPWGIALNRKMPWWEHVAGYFKYLQRAQHMLRQGKFVADVLLFYSEGAPTDLNYAYGNDVLSYVPKGYKFDGCDRNTLLHRLVVKDKKLCLPNGAAYRLLVLPESLPCTPVLLAKIKDLVEAGATLYGPKPIHSPSLTDYPAADKKVKKLAKEIWGKDDGREIGTLWKPPYNIEISGFINPGRNTLRVEVANTWMNRIVGDLNRKTAKTYTWSNSTHHYHKDSPLSRSGLIGPVFLRFREIITISHESIRRKK